MLYFCYLITFYYFIYKIRLFTHTSCKYYFKIFFYSFQILQTFFYICHLILHILQDLIELSTYFGIIRTVSSGWFVVTDPDTGEELTEKIHGIGNIKPYFEEHLDVCRRVYDKVYELLSNKETPNAVSYEKMLNINVEELFGINLDVE